MTTHRRDAFAIQGGADFRPMMGFALLLAGSQGRRRGGLRKLRPGGLRDTLKGESREILLDGNGGTALLVCAFGASRVEWKREGVVVPVSKSEHDLVVRYHPDACLLFFVNGCKRAIFIEDAAGGPFPAGESPRDGDEHGGGGTQFLRGHDMRGGSGMKKRVHRVLHMSDDDRGKVALDDGDVPPVLIKAVGAFRVERQQDRVDMSVGESEVDCAVCDDPRAVIAGAVNGCKRAILVEDADDIPPPAYKPPSLGGEKSDGRGFFLFAHDDGRGSRR